MNQAVFYLIRRVGRKKRKENMKDFELYKLNILFEKDGDGGGGDPAPKDPPDDGNPKDPPEDGDPKDPPKMIPYERFSEVNKKLRDLEAAEEKRIADEKAKKQKKLEDEKEFKTLYEDTVAEFDDFKKENLRIKVAYKKGLPEEAINRLVGETEEELEADAEKLLEILNVEPKKGVPPRNRKGNPKVLDVKSMTPEEIRKNKSELISGIRK